MGDDQRYPEPIAGGLVFGPNGDILLLRSHKWLGKFSIPGGHVELGETLADAIVREVKEETGLDVSDVEFLGIREAVFDPAYWKRRHFIMFNFVCRTDSTDVTLNSESEDCVWVPLSEAVDLPTEPHTAQVLREYRRRLEGPGSRSAV